MSENDVQVEEKVVKLTLYNIPEEVANEFQRIMRAYRGNTGRAAFTELIQRYKLAETLGLIMQRIDEVESRLDAVEEKKETKTFGGHVVRG